MQINIAIVDDRTANRNAVKSKLYNFKEINILFEAENGADFMEKLKTAVVLPDVVIMDLEMPIMNGLEAIQIAAANYNNMKFIVLTVYEDNDKIFEAIQAGANGYLLKEDSAVEIIDAITNVYKYNGIPMSPNIARKAMDILRKLPASTMQEELDEETVTTITEDNLGLSEREVGILKELASGKNYKQIAETLYISPMTVRKHVSNIYEKLHINNRAQLINLAYKKKWV